MKTLHSIAIDGAGNVEEITELITKK